MGTRNRSRFEKYRLRFITTTCNKWLPLFRSKKYFMILAESLEFVIRKYPSHLLAYVFMPNHIHLIILFDDGSNVSAFMRDFKKFTSTAIRKQLEADGELQLVEAIRYEKNGQKLKVWIDRFDDFYLTNAKSLMTKLNYIHENPVRKGLADRPEDYPYSSAAFHRKAIQGLIKLIPIFDVIGHANQYEYGAVY